MTSAPGSTTNWFIQNVSPPFTSPSPVSHTAERFGVADVFDAAQNVEAGARYLSWLLERYAGRADLALAGYNAGEGAVDRYAGIPPYRETRLYVKRVLAGAAHLSP